MILPKELKPVLAKIEINTCLGKSSWYEVVFYDTKWRSYFGSHTFEDNEQVVEWKYAEDCFKLHIDEKSMTTMFNSLIDSFNA